MDKSEPIIIIGAGMAGLAAGITLKNAGIEAIILEASDGVGGRVRTDPYKGFLLDRGFQVLLKSYPEAKRFLNYSSLNLVPFLPGAMILNETGKHIVMDPFRKPEYLIDSIFSPIGNLGDKLKMLKLRLELTGQTIDSLFLKDEITTRAYLLRYGFSEKMMQSFFKPFLGGIFLENELTTSSRMFEFVYKLFGSGDTVVPKEGMGKISEQLAHRFGYENIHLQEKVVSMEEGLVVTDRANYSTKAIFFAGGTLKNLPNFQSKPAIFSNRKDHPRSAYTLYFKHSFDRSQMNIIGLNSQINNYVNTIAFMDQVSPLYAPKNSSLLSVTLKDPHLDGSSEDIAEKVKLEMSFWYPDSIFWEFLKAYKIDYALPDQDHVTNDTPHSNLEGFEKIYVCGDFTMNGSINAALKSGRLAAEQYITNI